MTPNTPLKIAAEYSISYDDINKVVGNAVKSIKKCYSFTGSYTFEDLHHTGWNGAISAINQEKFGRCKNKLAYIYTFARGYMTHALHRKSRVVKVPWEELKLQKPTAHLSYSWGNLPEPGVCDPEPDDKYGLLAQLSDKDAKKILRGLIPSLEGQVIVNKIKALK
jgi:hypothetical protein